MIKNPKGSNEVKAKAMNPLLDKEKDRFSQVKKHGKVIREVTVHFLMKRKVWQCVLRLKKKNKTKINYQS